MCLLSVGCIVCIGLKFTPYHSFTMPNMHHDKSIFHCTTICLTELSTDYQDVHLPYKTKKPKFFHSTMIQY